MKKYIIAGIAASIVLGFITVLVYAPSVSTPAEQAPAPEARQTPVQPVILTTGPVAKKTPIFISSLNAYDREMLTNMNLARAAAGLPLLKENRKLDRVAADKVADLEISHNFSHLGSDGEMSWHWFVSEGYVYQYAGENLAENFTDTEAAFAAYMASPTHMANILNEKYTEVGLSSDGHYEAVEFASPQ